MPTYQKIACLFPGQGSQYPGLGKDLYDMLPVVRDTYAEASDALDYDIADLSFNAPAEQVHLTRYTQPLLLTHSVACLRAFHSQTKNSCQIAMCMAAGHSLGEYTALVCADALSFSLALKLVKKRGELMGKYGQGQMAALLLDSESTAELCGRHHCAIAACNLPEQTVVGGKEEDLDALIHDMATRFPRKRSTRLKTEGAFHTYYMIEAALKFRNELTHAEFKQPSFRVLSNFTGDFHADDIESIKSRLFLQLFNPVLWHKNLMQVNAHGAEVLIEFGGGLGKGEAAADKRPPLESIVKKTCQSADMPPLHFAVINADTLAESASALV